MNWGKSPDKLEGTGTIVGPHTFEPNPVTGRSHQLRVHCLSMGHPILGDRFYADEQVITKEKRLCLHAQALKIFHPVSDDELFIECPSEF